jgi:3-hydroxyacyl-CoA dehydrogenase
MIVEAGRLGQKTGAGWFCYEKGDRTPHPDPELAGIIKQKAAELGVPPSATRRSSAGSYSPRSTRPARSSKRARLTAPATST